MRPSRDKLVLRVVRHCLVRTPCLPVEPGICQQEDELRQVHSQCSAVMVGQLCSVALVLEVAGRRPAHLADLRVQRAFARRRLCGRQFRPSFEPSIPCGFP